MAAAVLKQEGGLRPILADLLGDLFYGGRVLARRPGFTLVAILTLALGIGASTAIFSVVNGILLRPLPYPQPERLAMLWESNFKRGWARQLVSLANIPDYRASASIEDIAAIWIRSSLLTGGEGYAETVTNARVEYRFFSTLGVQPALGRAFLAEEDRSDGNAFVILSHGLWMRRFGGDQGVLGQSLQLDGRPVEVVGVMPAGFHFPNGASIWTPLGIDPLKWPRIRHSQQAILRLAPSASWEQARSELEAVAAALEKEYPDTNSDWGVALVPLRDQMVGIVRRPLAVLMAAAGLLLLIACANVAGLLLAWSSARVRELAVRSALGAGRGRLSRQLLAENALLALAGGILGIALAWGGVSVLQAADRTVQPRMEELLADVASETGQLPRLQEAGIDSFVLLFALSASAGTILLFGLYPALRASRLSPQASLKEGIGASAGMAGVRLRTLLIVTQVAMALVLLMGSGLLLRSFQQLLSVNPGFRADGLLSFRITVPPGHYPDDPSQAAFHDRLLDAVRALPGVKGVASYWFLPFHNGTFPSFYSISKIGTAEGGEDPDSRVTAALQICSSGYHDLMRIQLLSGRTFSEQDSQESLRVAIVNQTLANQLWPEEDPLGRQFRLGRTPITVVGVAADTKRFGLTAASPLLIYIPFAQNPHTTVGVLARVSNSPLELAGPVREALRQIDDQAALSDDALVEEVIGDSVARERLTTLLAGGFAVAALLLAVVGLYGLISYLVGRRRHEFGIRLALGARASDVASLVLKSGLRLILAGVVLGLGAAMALTRFLSSILYNVSVTDTVTYLSVPCLLLAAALLACYIPARRATRIDPIQALRYE